ncbi:hypothetical protein HDU87_008212 [Geranomyces variabilis]|uniref:Non-specific serine/threonine protein kinase n=1 Tax=Geranomyces variabilis TaxID=109894 RepID=A0AAD5TFJ9_9FUNG|nr:hypothetical protein HDU87_008212 [Geranomyces variabilis]
MDASMSQVGRDGTDQHMSVTNVDLYVQRLGDTALDASTRWRVSSELRESIETFQDEEHPDVLLKLIPVISRILLNEAPVFISTSPVQKMRNALLEIIQRLPPNEHLKQLLPGVMNALMRVLKEDNEENAALCLKILVDLHKAYKPHLEEWGQPFFTTVQQMYKNMDETLKETFDDADPTVTDVAGTSSPIPESPVNADPATPTGDGDARILRPSQKSFKVLTECPIIIALLFQLYRKFVNVNIPIFVPLIVNCLSLKPSQQKQLLENADAQKIAYVGLSPEIKNKVAMYDLITLQVKTVSFIAYILRSFVPALKPFQQEIADAVVVLMRSCPPDAAATRKELLVATRHIWYTEFRNSFVTHVDVLLNEDVLVGAGVTAKETLRPIAHSVLVDLIHHVRNDLSPPQLSMAIHMYSRNLHDPGFAPNIQTMCAKLLLNIVDCLGAVEDKVYARVLLLRIMRTLAQKCTALKNAFPSIVLHYRRPGHPKKPNETTKNEVLQSLADSDGFLDLGYAQPIQTYVRAFETTIDIVRDVRFLFKNIVLGLKSVLNSLRQCNPPPAQGIAPEVWNQLAYGFTGDDVKVLVDVLRDGLWCFDYWNVDLMDDKGKVVNLAEKAVPLSGQAKEEKEIFESFASLFVIIEPATFQEIFTSQLEYIFDQILRNISVLALPQYFLASTVVSSTFAGLMLRFLTDRLEKLGDADQLYSSVMLRLFKLLFMSVTLFPEKNEAVLRPQIGNIIMSSMKLSAKAKNSLNYFLLLRALFRSIGGGRFEMLYQEVLPLLQVLLEGLNSLLATARQPQLRELFVELCLTVPVRLSVLLPYLSYLMKPLVLALEAGPDLVSQGVRTLELCVDNLTQDFLEPIMAPVLKELMAALRKHLRPLPYNHHHSHAAVRILGKLGGRNRRYVKDPLTMAVRSNMENHMEISLSFHSVEPKTIALDAVLKLSQDKLDDPSSSADARREAFNLNKLCLPLVLDVEGGGEESQARLLTLIRLFCAELATPAADPADAVVAAPGEADKPKPPENPFIEPSAVSADKKEAHDQSLKRVIVAMFAASMNKELHDEAWALVEDIVRHFAILSVVEMMEFKKRKRLANYKSETFLANVRSSHVTGFIEAIIEVITSEIAERREAAEKAAKLFYSVCLSLLRTQQAMDQLPVLHRFASRFSSCCYKQEWFHRTGGCLGISLFTTDLDLGPMWMLAHQMEFVKALVYVLKDRSPDMAMGNMEVATATLYRVLRVCTRVEPTMTPEQRRAKFHSLTSLLVSELSDSSSAVREGMQGALVLMAELMGCELTELLAPVKQTLLSRIFAKPLRALPFAMQIGHIDAITYCLTLQPPLLNFGDELMRLISEALALADAEDQALISKTSQTKNMNALVNLRVICIKLLSAAMACSEFSRQVSIRSRIVSVFFKSLYSKSPEVVIISYKGLQQIILQQGKLPKDQLQSGLRPILVNLSDHKRLTVAGLEGLARLLKLLTNYFKVEIGKKLLDHLRNWGNPQMLADAAGKPLSEIDDIKVMVAILNIFPLLPPSANLFMEDMIAEIVQLESKIRRTISSPFRPPLITFLNRYPTEGAQLFFDNLHRPEYGNMLIDLVLEDEASDFRKAVMESVDTLVEKSIGFSPTEPEGRERRFLGVVLTSVLARKEPAWIGQNPKILASITALWTHQLDQPLEWQDPVYSPGRITQLVADIFIGYLRTAPDDIDTLFQLVRIFEQEDVIDFAPTRQFLYEEIVMSPRVPQKRLVIIKYLEMFDDEARPQRSKAHVLRYLVTPLMRATFESGNSEGLIDTEMITTIHRKIWVPHLSETGPALNLNDYLKVELLQFTTLLVHYTPAALSEIRKDVIKFAWNGLKAEDVICKQAAYVLLARFIEEYDTPPKIVAQIYVALLRAHQSDTPQGRVLVRQALDILVPMLPKRFGANIPGESPSALPLYVRWTRKIIIEDGHSFAQLVTLYQLLARYPDLFYDYKGVFVPQILKSLPRLGFSSHATHESRGLTADLCELLILWDMRNLGIEDPTVPWSPTSGGSSLKRELDSQEQVPRKKLHVEPDAMEVDPVPATEEVKDEQDTSPTSIVPDAEHSHIVSYLTRIAAIFADPIMKKGFSFRMVTLVRQALRVWPDANVPLAPFDKIGPVDPEANYNLMTSAVEILRAAMEVKSSEWMLANLGTIQKHLEKWVKAEDVKLSKSFSPILSRLYAAIEDLKGDPPDAVINFTRFVDSKITSGLKEATASPSAAGGSTVNSSPGHVYCILSLVQGTQGKSSDKHIADLMKLLSKLVRDHEDQPPSALEPQLADPSRLLIMLLEQLKHRAPQMAEYRKAFLLSLGQIMEFSTERTLLGTILSMIRYWIVGGSQEAFPTAREKSSLMAKMMICAEKDQNLLEEYLELVAQIYSNPTFIQSEVTVRLEPAFLLGTRNTNPTVRRRFAGIFDQSIGRSVFVRLNYILGVQNWDHLAAHFWPRQALDLLLGCVVANDPVCNCAPSNRTAGSLALQSADDDPAPPDDQMAVDEAPGDLATGAQLIEKHRQFLINMQTLQVEDLIDAVRQLMFFDNKVTYTMWVELFPVYWGALSSRERHDMHKAIIPLLAKDYHTRQMEIRPNVIQALLEGISRCEVSIQPRLPPQLVRYLGKNYDAWYIAIELLQQSVADTRFSGLVAAKDDEKIRESTMDAMCELFHSLSEHDYFFGLWRRRSLFVETNAAVSYESAGLWSQAQRLYEAAQAKARTGVMPFTESEYRLWEEHWIGCAEKLQQWDLLTDLAKSESNAELFLECAWRLSDWMSDRETLQLSFESLHDLNPKRKLYQAFMYLVRQHEGPHIQVEFQKTCEEGVQNTLKQWYALPHQAIGAHVELLHSFQQFVELTEGSQIQAILGTTTALNIVEKTQEMKGVLSTWKDRLPNLWDDISIWSSLVAWRQHVFQIINKAYLPLIPHLNAQHSAAHPRDNPSSHAFRGYHETAWIINRFAHVARKQQLIDVCNDSLSKIYTLPNIEIHEAFFKLREQAKSYFVNATDYATGLDVINNTNLLYFNPAQKAEFFALKGIFFAKLNLHEDAERAFSSSIQLETTLPKGWAAYAQYHDRMFKERPHEIKYGVGAMNCYLQAAGLYQNGRARKFMARVLWLLNLNDAEGSISESFDEYKGEMPIWYWITFIPQLLSALSSKEAPQAKEILKKIAKQYPQALYFQLRTAREDLLSAKKAAAAAAPVRPPEQPPTTAAPDSPATSQPAGENGAANPTNPATPVNSVIAANGTGAAARKIAAWEHVEEINAVVKTAFPLLALSMETMLDQIMQRLKPTTDEDIYRLIVALLNDGVQMFVQQLTRDSGDQGGALSPATEMNLLRFAESMYPNHIKYKAAFEHDFIKSKPNLAQLVERFRDWRDKLEILLDSRPRRQYLEQFSHWLAEFEYQKFEDIEVPGQYFLMRDNNKDFVRIERFESGVDLIRGYIACHRRVTIRGHDGSFYPFSVQHPAQRHCRREERIMQLFRILNSVLERRNETRRRNISFHLPIVVPLAPSVRLVEDDPSYITLQEVWEQYCATKQQHKDVSIMYSINRLRDVYSSEECARRGKMDKVEVLNLKAELLEDIATKFMPETILTKYMSKTLTSYGDLWTMRKQFTHSLASNTFMTHVLSVGQRSPHKISISRNTGNIWFSDLLPGLAATTSLFANSEPVPFRFTPNIQHFLTPIGVEGVFATSLQAIGRALTEPNYELEDYLSIFVRDELVTWQSIVRKPPASEAQLRETTLQNVDLILKRTAALACKEEREKGLELCEPANQTVLDLISNAVNPHKLCQMDASYMARL